jgi:glycosyltransferase involved in cell wall biosynthesis
MTRAGEPLVSVVTPVYNTAAYLRECIESVLAQTYENWEYLIADNRSTDGSLEIAREYADKDSRVHVHTFDDFVSGLVNANRALRLISPASRYCKVLHADDWLFPECLAQMVELAEENPSVGVVSAYRLQDSRMRRTWRVSLDGLPYTVNVLPGREVCRSTFLGGPYPYVFGSPTSTLVRSDLVRAREHFYNTDNPFQADQEACLELLKEADFGFVHQVLTFTRRHGDAGFAYYYSKVGAQLPGRIDLLVRYGPAYLTPNEYRRRLATLVFLYARFLARNTMRLKDPEFRSYQRTALERLRAAIEPADVGKGILLQLSRLGPSVR